MRSFPRILAVLQSAGASRSFAAHRWRLLGIPDVAARAGQQGVNGVSGEEVPVKPSIGFHVPDSGLDAHSGQHEAFAVGGWYT